jgi:hypothetical protein
MDEEMVTVWLKEDENPDAWLSLKKQLSPLMSTEKH